MQRLTQLGGHDMQVWRLSALFLQTGRVAEGRMGRGASVIFALDKFNAAFKSLSACQLVWCCLIDIYICALCKGFRIYIVRHREREREKNTNIKKQKYCLMMNMVRVRVYVRSSPLQVPCPFFCNCFFGWHFRFRFRLKKKKEIRNTS